MRPRQRARSRLVNDEPKLRWDDDGDPQDRYVPPDFMQTVPEEYGTHTPVSRAAGSHVAYVGGSVADFFQPHSTRSG